MQTQTWAPSQPCTGSYGIQKSVVRISTIHRRGARGRSATPEEKVTRLHALTDEEYTQLLGWAKFTAKKFVGAVNDADGADLLHEAILRAVDARNIRNWYLERIDFLPFLRGCIRSIADEWCKRARSIDLPDDLPSPTKPGVQAEADLMLDKIRDRLKARPHAVEILDLKRDGLTAKEIQKSLAISERIYTAAVRWMNRTVRRDFLTDRRDGQTASVRC